MKFYKKTIIRREDNEPYLVRYSLFSCRWFAIKIHNILLSDPSCIHDHPWSFMTFIFKGSYKEQSRIPGTTYLFTQRYKRFSLLYRPAKYAHRLIIGKPVWTFVITFRKVRTWGFLTPKGWVKWINYSPKNNCE